MVGLNLTLLICLIYVILYTKTHVPLVVQLKNMKGGIWLMRVSIFSIFSENIFDELDNCYLIWFIHFDDLDNWNSEANIWYDLDMYTLTVMW
jgi:hypothetical protein